MWRGLLLLIACCSDDAAPLRDARPADATSDVPPGNICTSTIGGCAEQVPLDLAGTWTLTGNHTAQPPGTPLGMITLQLTFTPVTVGGCEYTVTATGKPANAGAYWPDPAAGSWYTNGFSAALNAFQQVDGRNVRISWSYCQRHADGTQQITGDTSIYQATPQPMWIFIEGFSASTVTKQ